MKRSMLGILAAGAVASMLGSTALAEDERPAGSGMDDAKACYRTECGKSVKGHEGKCGGTKVDGISAEKVCTDAGGAWTTAADAEEVRELASASIGHGRVSSPRPWPSSCARFGAGFRTPHFDAIARAPRALDWFEVLSENFIGSAVRAARCSSACARITRSRCTA